MKLIISHYDGHGICLAAARYVISISIEDVDLLIRKDVTGPEGLSSGKILEAAKEKLDLSVDRIEVLDIALDVQNPEASVETLRKLGIYGKVLYADHHNIDLERRYLRDLPLTQFTILLARETVELAMLLDLLNNEKARELAIIGSVCDRDPAVLSLVSRQQIESKYLPLANKLDTIIRNPVTVGLSSLEEIAVKLAEEGIKFLESVEVEYPPEKISPKLTNKIIEESRRVLLVDWSDVSQSEVMWVPKTLEQLLTIMKRDIVIAIVKAFRGSEIVGYDVRILKYWLSNLNIDLRELVRDKKFVGHEGYVSVRFTSLEDAIKFAKEIFEKIEKLLSLTK